MVNLSKNHPFFRSGAVVRWGDIFHCFWGTFQAQAERPLIPSIYAPDFFLKATEPWYVFENYRPVSKKDLAEAFGGLGTLEGHLHWEEPNRQVFDRQFARIQKWFQEERLSKCVPFVFSESSDVIDQPELVARCLNSMIHKEGYTYGLWNADEMILGQTPEILIKQSRAQIFETMALAGTQAWNEDTNLHQHFENDPKESFEQNVVTEFLRETLQSHGTLTEGARRVVRAGSLAHLLTPLELAAKADLGLQALVHELHPTPALGCYPKKDWSVILDAMVASHWRGRYGAPFGVSLSAEQALVLVAIRNIQGRGGKCLLGTGCGVVPESQPDREWQELGLKRASVMGVMGL